MCGHLFKLPLYLIALPFFILSAIGRGGLCAVSGGGRLWRGGGQHRQRNTDTETPRKPLTDVKHVVPRRWHEGYKSQLAFGTVTCLALVAATVIGLNRRGLISAHFDEQLPALRAFEFEQLLVKVTGPQRPPIPVAFAPPPESGEDLPPAESEFGTSEEQVQSISYLVFRGTEPKGQDADQLPSWVTDDSITTIPELSGVITTGPHATVEDAEQEALLTLRKTLSEMFARTQPSANGWLPPEEFVLDAGVVEQRAVERSELVVGEFNEPVFRAYWDITHPEGLESQLFAAWRPEVLKSRLWLLGAGMGLLTLLFGSLASYFRLDDATQGKYRNKLRVGTGALWALAAAGSALLIVA